MATTLQAGELIPELMNVTNSAEPFIAMEMPYRVSVTIVGVAPMLLHGWNVQAIREKAGAKKGSKAKTTDDLESYVFRTEDGALAVKSTYLRGAIVEAARYKQDPRSPRKSAIDLFKAAIFPTELLHILGSRDNPHGPVHAWDYVDEQRAPVQRQGITRSRPAFHPGWTLTAELEVVLPEYISPALLNETIQLAGRVIGIADFRPTYGRFQVTDFKVVAVE